MKTNLIQISLFVVTENEEDNIGRLLESVKQFDEIIVVDSGSRDRTIEIANSYGAKVFNKDWMGYAKQKQFALSLCTNDWVINLDADEALNPKIVEEIRRIIQQNTCDAVQFNRNDIFINSHYSKLTKRPNNLRLFKRSKGQFDTNKFVHESASISGRVIKSKVAFDHYGYNDIAILTEKCNSYSSLKAQEKFSKNKKSSTLKLALIFPLIFIKIYFIQRYIFSGKRGLIQAIIATNYAFLKEAKLYELEQKKD